MKQNLIFCLFFGFIFSCCSAPGMLPTNTGKPEIIIPKRTLQEVSNALAEWSIAHGFDITKTTFFSLDGDRVEDSSSALHNINIGTHQRVIFNYAETLKGIYVSGDFRSGPEELGNMKERSWLQQQLDSVVNRISTR